MYPGWADLHKLMLCLLKSLGRVSPVVVLIRKPFICLVI